VSEHVRWKRHQSETLVCSNHLMRPPARENFIANWIYVPFGQLLIWCHSVPQETLCSLQLVSDALTHYSATLVQIKSIATQGTRLVNYSNRYSGGLSHNHLKPILYVGNTQQFLLQQVVYMFTNLSKTSFSASRSFVSTVMRRITRFRSTTDRIYDCGPIII